MNPLSRNPRSAPVVFVRLVWFDALRSSQQLWSCRGGQFTEPHFFPGQA